MSEEHKKKIGLSNSISLKGKHCSPKTEFKKGLIPWNKGMIMEETRGEKSPHWNGGISIHIRRRILKENNKDIATCQICKEKPKKIVIHHIDGNKHNNKINNLGVICHFCHNAIHDNLKKVANRFQIGHKLNKHI